MAKQRPHKVRPGIGSLQRRSHVTQATYLSAFIATSHISFHTRMHSLKLTSRLASKVDPSCVHCSLSFVNNIFFCVLSQSLRSFSTVPVVTPSVYQGLYSAPSTDVTSLKSGMRVASQVCFNCNKVQSFLLIFCFDQTIHGETATVGVWIDAGSRYETAANSGVAHFLEHISFKGTQKRTQQKLEEEIENMGGHLNAYTSREQTVYYARVFKNDVPQAMEILSDILTNSLMDKEAIERERDVILREMVEVNKVYEEQILDHLHETAFMGNGLGRTILGPEENIKKLTRDDLVNYVQTHYTANR